jgi:YHS domain-containing protein
MPRWLKWTTLALALVVGAAAFTAHSIGLFATAPVFSTANGAIDGYDPVAFHLDGRAVPGDPAITAEWRGATWRFTSAEHKRAFEQDPERYAPAYGGYCATAMAGNYTANGDPNAFSIDGGRLFLNFDEGTRDTWLAERSAMITTGDRNWPQSRPAQAIPET